MNPYRQRRCDLTPWPCTFVLPSHKACKTSHIRSVISIIAELSQSAILQSFSVSFFTEVLFFVEDHFLSMAIGFFRWSTLASTVVRSLRWRLATFHVRRVYFGIIVFIHPILHPCAPLCPSINRGREFSSFLPETSLASRLAIALSCESKTRGKSTKGEAEV